ncbi:MAG: replication initiator protein WhiP [Aeropyrum sp.]|nr:replication initiator protein WhiP [Aeropyrum sp.]MCE4616709.1 replication initiator protein WhiP [Aeropyrum sp.]
MSDDLWRAVKEYLEQHEEAKAKARGRRGPRSRLVDAILVMLLAKPMRAAEIAGILGYQTRYVSSYLSYWKTRGYVEYEAGLWYLTPLGEEYAREVLERESRDRFNEFAVIAQRILSTVREKPAINDKRRASIRGAAGKPLPFIAGLKGKPDNKPQERAASARCALEVSREDLTGDELEVMSFLLDHYAKWGTTYIYLDQMQEEMGADFQWLVKTLRGLQTKGYIYIYRDPRLGMRVGLSKKSKELIEACEAGARL